MSPNIQQQQNSDDSPTRVRFLVVALCMVMSVLLYLDRFALSPATDPILRELKITKEEFGRTYFAFFFAYALLQVPAGWLSDRFGARGTLTLYRSEEHTSELQSHLNLVCRLLLEKK